MSEELEKENPEEQEQTNEKSPDTYRTIHLGGMYENWFLDYASYVILERAVPAVIDGLKPVQRRILHAMKELDDGRYNKVANIIGHTMKYHPHGDASIGDALVQLGQKELLIDTQGNWGNVITGDPSAAPRYIEARLSKFALDVVFNPKTTTWKASYDGRNKEPVTLPVKFPLLLAQGVEGIAVGLASKILSHNFVELIDASVNYLKGKDFEIYPDFLNGGLADFSKYNDGKRGGKVRLRAKISKVDNKTLAITEIPYGTTTSSLIDSIVAANDKGKIKIKKIDDNTAENVEVLIHLAGGVSPDQTIDALYAFSNCEVSISPNACIIDKDKPMFIGVSEILKISTDKTVELLRKELEIRKMELEEEWHFLSLEKIFIEKRIYRKIENSSTWEEVIDTIDKGLDPYKKNFKREITQDDIVKLTEIRIKRISKYSTDRANEKIAAIEGEIEEVKTHLENLIDYTINYFRQIKKKYGKERERRTEIRSFDTIEATMVAAATHRLYVNREEGFAGFSLKRDEFVCECSDIDDIIAFRDDGTFVVTKVAPKTFVGKNVIHIDVFKRNDDRTIYNMIYRDGFRGKTYVKRFAVLGVTRDKEYDLTRGSKGTKVLYFTANPNGEAELVKIYLRPKPRLRNLSFEFDFSELDIKGRNAKGNTLTKHAVREISKKEEGVSTLGAVDIWYDDTVKRLNTEERGKYLGAFHGDDKVLTVMQSGKIRLNGYDVSTHFEEDMIMIQKFEPSRIFSVIYFEGEQQKYYVKRFQLEEETPKNKDIEFISQHPDSELIAMSLDRLPRIEVEFKQKKDKKPIENEVIELDDFIAVKGETARGKRVTNKDIKSIRLIDPLPYEEIPENAGEDQQGEEAQEKPGNENYEEGQEKQEIDSAGDMKDDVNKGPESNGTWQMSLDL